MSSGYEHYINKVNIIIIIIIISNSNWTEWGTIQGVIVSITKFSTVIGSPRAYLPRNRIYNKFLDRDGFSVRLFVT